MSKQTVVVIGGGAAGANIAHQLAVSPKFNTSTTQLVFITPRKAYVHWPAMLRAVTTSEGNVLEQSLMPFDSPAFIPEGKGEVKYGKVASIVPDSASKDAGGNVVLESGEKIAYSVLVVATGNKWNGPLAFPESEDVEEVKSFVAGWREKIKDAKEIVLVGGGAVAIELAGEVKDFYPEKNVTIVHGDAALLNGAYPDKYRRKILSVVEAGGVKVVLDDFVDQVDTPKEGGGSVTTRKGKVIKADVVIPTWGGRPATGLVSESLSPSALSSTGHVKVKPTLQLEAYPRIFAAGDIIDWKEQKQAAKAPAHAAVVVANVLALVGDASAGGKLVEYKGSSEMILVTFGRSGGATYMGVLWGLVFGSWFTRMVKSKGLFIEMTRGQAGLGKLPGV